MLMKRLLPLALVFALAMSLAGGACAAADPLEGGFHNPPAQTKPWCYWYWVSDNISKEGITRDLEAMARVGIGEALIGNIFLDEIPAGKIKVLTPEWWDLVAHAIREGARTGVNIGMFNCPGWSQSGGPWIKPSQTMRYVAASETRVRGPKAFAGKLPAPKEPFQDIAVLAFPAPQADADALAARSPRVTCTPAAPGAEKLVDGDPSTAMAFPQNAGRGNKPFTVQIELPAPLTARSLQITPSAEPFSADCELQAASPDGSYRTVSRFKCDRSNMAQGVGFMPRGPVAVAFAATTAKAFRLAFTNVQGRAKQAELAEINLSGAARLQSFVEKQLGKMHPTPLPMWDAYLWPTQAEPDSARLVIPTGEVRDLTKNLSADGELRWDVPEGDWVILRTGMTPTGMRNSPASPEGQGLEVDKMNRELAQTHFNAFIGEVLRRIPAADRSAFKQVIADSYEMGSQNWTDGFDAQFKARYGYDPKPWLPVLTGRLVGGADQSERFLWDLRRLVADRVATDYVGGLREASNAHGLGLWLENYGHWGFPGEFLKYGSQSDRIGGEFWVTGDLGSIECRAASSCANTYGKPFVSAESFTGGPAFQNAPGALKARGDWSFCEGVNHVVLHVYIEQPWTDKAPGVNAPWGTEFNRNNTWFERSKSWIDYERRCCWMLQQGWRVADVAYFIGEDAPKMTGVRSPELPQGYDFDYINAEVIEKSMGVKDGVLTLPHGTTYRVLVLPGQQTMRPELLRKIVELVKAGATVIGTRPSRSPSMENFPKCDEAVQTLARELWGEPSEAASGERALGKGRVIWGRKLEEVLASLSAPPDFESSTSLRYTHRRSGGAEIYFVANPKAEPVSTTAAFRAGARAPELWWADSERIERPAVYDESGGIVRLPLQLGPHGSVFVVFREGAAPSPQRIVSVTRDGREMLGVKVTPPPAGSGGDSANNFTLAAWVRPQDDTTLVAEINRGVRGMSEKRNDLLTAPHGNTYGGPDHVGCGLAVGRNGVCVFEHGANTFAPTLVHAAAITDWTHLAVVYRDGQPSLYLNGKLAHTGLKSAHIVHSGGAPNAASAFRGQVRAFESFPKALTAAEVAGLMETTPQPAGPASPLKLTLNPNGQVETLAADAGAYELKFADGSTRKLVAPAVAPAMAIEGPWEVSFTPGMDAPERVQFDALVSWTQRPEPGVRYYSGKALYRKQFELPPAQANAAPGARIMLDLGEVRDLATVKLNGRELGALWLAPWQVDITSAVKPGANTLEVEVINPWNNRLVGDAALPPEQRHSTILLPTVKSNTPLLPAGLLGPVALRFVSSQAVK